MEDSNTHRYVTKLQSFVKTMNTRENRSIEMAPINVTNMDAIRLIHKSRQKKKKERPTFVAGDYVRAVLKDTTFRKGYKPQFSREIYKIKTILTTDPVTYRLIDKNKKPLPARFYEKQLIHYSV